MWDEHTTWLSSHIFHLLRKRARLPLQVQVPPSQGLLFIQTHLVLVPLRATIHSVECNNLHLLLCTSYPPPAEGNCWRTQTGIFGTDEHAMGLYVFVVFFFKWLLLFHTPQWARKRAGWVEEHAAAVDPSPLRAGPGWGCPSALWWSWPASVVSSASLFWPLPSEPSIGTSSRWIPRTRATLRTWAPTRDCGA